MDSGMNQFEFDTPFIDVALMFGFDRKDYQGPGVYRIDCTMEDGALCPEEATITKVSNTTEFEGEVEPCEYDDMNEFYCGPRNGDRISYYVYCEELLWTAAATA